MEQSAIFALDFDGVICDSAVETGITGWKAAAQLWNDFESAMPTSRQIEQFCQIRPIMGTGYEAILIVRMINDGEPVESILKNYQARKQVVMDDYQLKIEELKILFGATRDAWIKNDLHDWVEKNPLFPSVVEKLQGLSEQHLWYIVTTKQERFVKQILSANKIPLPDDRIFGLDRKLSKEEILLQLQDKHSEKKIYFVEDMLSTLIKVLNNSQLQSVKLFMALWGYNTTQDKRDAQNLAIELIELDSFLGV